MNIGYFDTLIDFFCLICDDKVKNEWILTIFYNILN